MDAKDEVYLVADELRAIATLGKRYAENHYDQERYEKVLSLSARLVAAIDQRTVEDVMVEYGGNLSHVSPIVGAEAAVFRNERILLIRREDNGLWAMPGGLTDVGETWAQSAERELREEAGVQGRATELLGVFDSRLWGSRNKYQFYSSVWLVHVEVNQIPVAGPETTDVGFFNEDALPDLSPGTPASSSIGVQIGAERVTAPFLRCDHLASRRQSGTTRNQRSPQPRSLASQAALAPQTRATPNAARSSCAEHPPSEQRKSSLRYRA